MRHTMLVLSTACFLCLAAPLASADMPVQPPGVQEFSYSGAGLRQMSPVAFRLVMSRIQARCARKIVQLGGDTSSTSKMRICMNAVSSERRLGIVARERVPEPPR